ncbi:MAG: spondin domain-containing protein [Planctomycetota bacterium]
MKKLSFALLFCLAASTAFAQTQIRVTVTTEGPVGLAPVFAAFHDGSYDIFDTGATSSAELETLAEVGDPSGLVGAAPAGVTAGGFAPGGPFAPNGGTGSMDFTVANNQTSFSFASMVLPTNDWFIGNNVAYDISSLINAAPGTTLTFDQTRVYDAGTEEEDFAFAPGGGLVGITTPADPAGGASTMDAISLVTGPDPFAAFDNIEPVGFDTTTIDFTNGSVATLSLTVVPEPASLGMAAFGLLSLLGLRRRR